MKKLTKMMVFLFAVCATFVVFGAGANQAYAAGNVVVVLDPGHDETHTGAYYHDTREEELNLKIALACYNELKQYEGVDVYLTRSSMSCAFPGTSTSNCLLSRVQYASDRDADLFVSLHNNAGDEGDRGTEIYYPNGNYRGEFSTIGYNVSSCIMNQLMQYGMENRGLKTRTSNDADTYPDGSVTDYYSVIRNSKLYGFPGIIVEHAYMSDDSDYDQYLSSDEMLRNFGIADAKGIANYFGLYKETGTVYKGVDYKDVFDAAYYAENNKDIVDILGSDERVLLKHFVESGMAEHRHGCADFDVMSYKNLYSDLQNAFGDDYKAYYMHYINFGKAEGRIATGYSNIDRPVHQMNGTDYAAVYNYDTYIAQNPDVAEAFGNDDIAVLNHFVNFGMKEGRSGNGTFQVSAYKLANADLRKAFYGEDNSAYYYHYINFGQYEGRITSGVTMVQNPITEINGRDYKDVYDYQYYVDHNSDVKAAYGNDDIMVLQHFINFGMNEGRRAKADFDVLVYRSRYADLQEAFGTKLADYYNHFINFGKAEGRVAVLPEETNTTSEMAQPVTQPSVEQQTQTATENAATEQVEPVQPTTEQPAEQQTTEQSSTQQSEEKHEIESMSQTPVSQQSEELHAEDVQGQSDIQQSEMLQ